MTQHPPPQGWKSEVGIAIVVFAATATVFTWPLLPNITTAIPSGCGPPTVSLFGLFTIEWTGQVIEQNHSYWDAPIFHPHAGTFAWSEPQPATSLGVWILSKFVGLIPAYNACLLLYLVASGCTGYALARQLTQDRLAAIWAGVWLTAGAYPLQQLGVLHLLAFFWPAGCLALVLSLVHKVRWWAVWGVGLTYLITWLTCAQFGLFLTLLLPVVVLPLIPWKRWRWRRAAYLCTPTIMAALLVCPLLLQQRAHLAAMGNERSLENVSGVLMIPDLVTPAKGHWLTTQILGWDLGPDVYSWDVGIVPLLCILTAGLLHLFRPGRADPAQQRLRLALAVMSLAALLLAFGPTLGVSVHGKNLGPYALLHAFVPGLDSVRSPARFAMFVAVGVAALSAPAFAFLRHRAKTRRGRQAVTVAGFVLLFSEMWTMPIALSDPSEGIDDHQEVINWLRQHGDGEPVLELPMSEGDTEAELQREVLAMRRGLRHGSPVINGYSGYFPEPFRQIRRAVLEDLPGRGRRFMDALGVRYVLIHNHDYPPASQPGLIEALPGKLVFSNGSDTIIRLPEDPTAHRPQLAMSNPNFDIQPRAGDILRIAVEVATARARLLIPRPGQTLPVTWRDASGRSHSAEVLLRGSLLVDVGARWVYLQLLRFTDRGSGEAVFISHQRVPGQEPSGNIR